MAYNTTTWEPDSNTKAGASTTNSKFHIYKSINCGIKGDITNNETWIPIDQFSDESTTNAPHHRYVWATGGNLVGGYFISDTDINNSSNAITFKVYRYRPDNSTNTGATDTKDNWTLIDTGTVTFTVADPSNRGLYITFSEDNCSFSKGDLMSITIHNDASLTTDELNFVFILKEDWNDIISSNV